VRCRLRAGGAMEEEVDLAAPPRAGSAGAGNASTETRLDFTAWAAAEGRLFDAAGAAAAAAGKPPEPSWARLEETMHYPCESLFKEAAYVLQLAQSLSLARYGGAG
jgi:hypothetical protein